MKPDDTQLQSARDHVDSALDANDVARDHLEHARDDLNPAPPVVVPLIDTPDAFDRAVSLAAAGDVLLLPTTFVYPGPLKLTRPVTLQSDTYVARQGVLMTLDEPAPRFLGGTDAVGDDVHLLGLEHRHTNPQTDIVLMRGARTLLDRPRVLGDAVLGGKRGINYSGSFGQILNWYVDDVFRLDQDTQAIYSDSMGPGGLLISHGYGRAAGETIMFGGADCPADRIPRGIRIDHCTLTKKPAWTVLLAPGRHAQFVKNALEFKNVDDAVVEDCVFEYAGSSGQQGAYSLVLTPRNQGGGAPWSTVQNVTIRRCTGRYASGAISILGDDDIHPSGRATNILIENCTFEALDPKYGGLGRIIYLNRGPVGVTITGFTASGTNLKSIVYFDEKLPPTRLTLRNMRVPPNLRYPWHNLYGDTLASVKQYAADAVLEVTPGDVGAVA